MDSPKVFREQIKEHRGDYYVSYQPADARFPSAFVQLTFLDNGHDVAGVKAAMEPQPSFRNSGTTATSCATVAPSSSTHIRCS